MQDLLTISQSTKLFDLGVPQEYASVSDIEDAEKYGWDYHKLFSLSDIIRLLPREIRIDEELYRIDIYSGYYKWFCGYDNMVRPMTYIAKKRSKELIVALYALLLWVIENGYLKFKK